MMADVANRRSHGEDFKHNPEFAKQVAGTVTHLPNEENNEFSKRLRDAIQEIEEALEPSETQ